MATRDEGTFSNDFPYGWRGKPITLETVLEAARTVKRPPVLDPELLRMFQAAELQLGAHVEACPECGIELIGRIRPVIMCSSGRRRVVRLAKVIRMLPPDAALSIPPGGWLDRWYARLPPAELGEFLARALGLRPMHFERNPPPKTR